jgi:FXSXX-COOH protein
MAITEKREGAAGLIGVVRVPLRDLLSRESDAALDEAIRRVTADAENDAQKSVSAFNSAI